MCVCVSVCGMCDCVYENGDDLSFLHTSACVTDSYQNSTS